LSSLGLIVPNAREEWSLPEAIARAAQAYGQGRFDEVEAISTAILKAVPDHFDALHLLGVLRGRQSRLAEALDLLNRATARNGASAQAWSNRGHVLYLLGRYPDAIASCERALAIAPETADALNNRGTALQALERHSEALTDYDRALAINPSFAQALNNRDLALHRLDRLDEALASYDRALTINPNYAGALNNRAATLHRLRRYDDALAACERALAVDPNHRDAWNNRGLNLFELGRFDAALASFDRALAVDPGYAEVLNCRAVTLDRLGRYEDAIAACEQVLARNPDDPHAFAGAADAALIVCDWERTARYAAELPGRVARQTSIIAPFRLLAYSADPALQRAGAELAVAQAVVVEPGSLNRGVRRDNGRIRIGYLSAQFIAHAGASLIAELIERHDRTRFAVIGLSLRPDDGSELRRRLVASFDEFHNLEAVSDRRAAELIRDLDIDIAVDLTGHSRDARLGILAQRPAPLQVSWLGHAGTMGARFIDYVIGDPVVAPLNEAVNFTEQIAQLPDCYLVTDTTRAIPAGSPDRGATGLPDDGFVFCCFNNNYKITAPVFERWMRLLERTDRSVLWLLRDNEVAERNLRRAAAARGIDPARLVFAPRVSPTQHLARHRLADLFLDTLPFNAHVTASDALWAGLPLVTCEGATFASRVAASALRAAGLDELITTSLDDYERLALSLACSPDALARVRQKLHDNRLTCPLFDTGRFRRQLESVYATMWDIARRGETLRSFAVTPVE
jgi:predicted O-linked N-acetylglucosamine transferase (SPINDLY family)